MQEFVDQELKCKDCPCTFVFSAGEQKFFAEKGLQPPVRCKPCRQARKAQKEGTASPQGAPEASVYGSSRPVMIDVEPPQRGGGGGGGKKGRGGGRRRDRDQDDRW